MKMRKKFRRGFTLVELVVVIAVIAILSAVSVGAYFGITDSANSSNATSALKQVKDMWLMYSVSDYDQLSDKSDDNVGTDFCLRYLPAQGYDQVYTNYKVVNIDYDKQSAVSPLYNFDSSKESGLLIKIETDYPTWFLIDGNRMIEESANPLKTDADFETSIIESKYIDATEENPVKANDFEIGTVMVDGVERRGFKYFYFEITPENGESNEKKIEKIKVNKSLDSIKDANGVSVYELKDVFVENGTNSYTSGKQFRLYDLSTNEEYLPTTVHTGLGDKDVAISYDEVDPSFTFNDYEYLVGKVELKQVYMQTSGVNFTNHPIALVQNGQIIYFKQFKDLAEFNAYSTNGGTILIGDKVVMDQDYGIPSKFTMVIESNKGNYSNLNDYSINPHDNLNTSDDKNSNKSTKGSFPLLNSDMVTLDANKKASFVSKDNLYTGATGYSLIINSGKKLTVKDGAHINLEGKIKPAAGGNAAGLREFGYIENNGSIILENNSTLKAFGRIGGNGSIDSKSGSKVYDIFKPTSYTGGTNTITSYFGSSFAKTYNEYLTETNKYIKAYLLTKAGTEAFSLLGEFENHKTAGIFPFIEYRFDNITCELIINYGAQYLGTTWVELFGASDPVPVNIVSNNDNCMMKMEEGSIISKKYNYNKAIQEFTLKQGTALFSNLSIDLRINLKGILERNLNLQSSKFNLPISNMNITISSGSTLKVCDYKNDGLNLDLYPSSSINNEGTIEISGKSKLGILDFTEAQYTDILTNKGLNQGLDGVIFNYLKANYLSREKMLINKGTIKVLSTTSGLYLTENNENNINMINDSHIELVSGYLSNTYKVTLPSEKNKSGNSKSVEGINISSATSY